MEWVATILIWLVVGVLFYLICLIVRWLCSKQNDCIFLGLEYIKRKESIPLNLQRLKDISNVGTIVCYSKYYCGGRYYYEKKINGHTECFHLSLTLPAYLYMRKLKKRKKQKAINQTMIDFLECVQLDIDEKRAKYYESINQAKDIMGSIVLK